MRQSCRSPRRSGADFACTCHSSGLHRAGDSFLTLGENIAGLLAYFTIIPAIVFLLIEPFNRNRFVRFHSFQSIFVHIAWVVVYVALGIVSSILHFIPVIGWVITAILWPLVGLAVLAIWLLLVVKAYQHQIYKLPVIGDLAEKQAGA